MRKPVLLIILSILCLATFGQTEKAPIDTLRKDALNVFMEASDYIRKEIPWVNYVRDIHDAGVYIISTSQVTGSGGWEYSYFFVGQKENAGLKDTLSFVTKPDETQEERRVREVSILKLGLMRYVAKTPLARYLTITFSEPISGQVSTDKWDSWVFKTSFIGWLDGQKSYKSSNLYGNFSASRVTKEWKLNFKMRYSQGQDNFIVDDGIIRSKNNSKSLDMLIVRSISEHWSTGGSLFAGSSSYSNYDFSATLMPGIEYDLYPYAESTRRQLRLLYTAGYKFTSYMDTTIYDKTREGHFMQTANAAYEVIQKWGSIDATLTYSNYLHDWSKNNLSLNAFVNLRVAKGLSVNFGGGASLIHDQLGLVKGGATQEEVLLRRKELATQFQYFTSFGFTYTFGSIYNNVVNPRFGNSGGGGMMISF